MGGKSVTTNITNAGTHTLDGPVDAVAGQQHGLAALGEQVLLAKRTDSGQTRHNLGKSGEYGRHRQAVQPFQLPRRGDVR